MISEKSRMIQKSQILLRSRVSGSETLYEAIQKLKKTMKSKNVVARRIGLCALIATIGAATVPDATQRRRPEEALSYAVVHNLSILADLDQGDVEAAKKKLETEAVVSTISLLDRLHFTKDPAVLIEHTGLRAAAKYWTGKEFPYDDKEIARETDTILAIIRKEMLSRSKPESSK